MDRASPSGGEGRRSDSCREHQTQTMTNQFCLKCSHRLQYTTKEGRKRLNCPACGFIFYNNSRPTGSALIVEGNKILLGKRSKAPLIGWWDVPGGFLESGEPPQQGTKREVKEELGLSIKILRQVGIYMDTYVYKKERFPTLNIIYLAKIVKGKPKIGDDMTDYRWFDKRKLPKNIAFKNARAAIADWLKQA